jgi:hypothetical protein
LTEEIAVATQMEMNTWHAMRNSFRTALTDRGLAIGENELRLVTRFALEEMESRRYRLLRVKPTAEMQAPVRRALDEGKRQSVNWVGPRVKNRWRYRAAIEAAPNWRRGYDHDHASQSAEDLLEDT